MRQKISPWGDSRKNTDQPCTTLLCLPSTPPSLRYFLPFDSFRSTAKLLAIRSSKEENGADKEKEEEEDDVTVVASLRRY